MSNKNTEIEFTQEFSGCNKGSIEIELNGREILGFSQLRDYKEWLTYRNDWENGSHKLIRYLNSLKKVYHQPKDEDAEQEKFVFFFNDGSCEIHFIEKYMWGYGLEHETTLNTSLKQFWDYNHFDNIPTNIEVAA